MHDDLSDASIRRAFRRMSQVQWGVSAAALLAVIALIAPSAIQVRYVELNLNVLFGVVFGAVALVYTYLRFDLKVATLCDTVAQLSAFVMVGGAASYVAAHYGAWSDFRDADLLRIDRAVGLDWRAYLHLMTAHPTAASLLDTAYRSILWQAAILIVVLTATNRSARLQVFTLAFQLSALLCVEVSALVPAAGAYPYLHISKAIDHPGIELTTMNLHAGSLMQLRGETPILPIGPIEGIVTFPSLHMALAILFCWAFWRVPTIRWAALGLNFLMILSTPLSGGHYFTDLAGGAVVAVLALFAATAIHKRVTRSARTPATSNAAAPLGAPAAVPAT